MARRYLVGEVAGNPGGGEGNEADLDLIGAETSDHLWRHITRIAERFPMHVMGTATLAVEPGVRAWAGTRIVGK